MMDIIKVIANRMGENCYIIKDGNVLAVIDPGGSAEKILSLTKDTNLKYILLTHGHFDHIAAVSEIKKQTGAKALISRNDAPMLSDKKLSLAGMYGIKIDETDADGFLDDGQEIAIGKSLLRVIETPGHTMGSVCFFGGGFLFSGDTLFKNTIGVFDYENRDIMKNSIEKLMELPDETIVCPGHNEKTTIAHEKAYNPYAIKGREWIL